MSKLNSKIPEGPIANKWTEHKNHMKLVAPNNRPKIDVIVVIFPCFVFYFFLNTIFCCKYIFTKKK